jgi:nitrous oxidase accessory protein NosD
MRSFAWAFVLVVSLLLTSGRQPTRRVVDVSTAQQLMDALRAPVENVIVQLAPGTYTLTTTSQRETIGSCGETGEITTVTVALRVTGERVRIVGPEEGEAVVRADATYPVYFDQCSDCELERVTIAGDVADNKMYGGASVAANQSSVRIANCSMRDDGPALQSEAGPLKWVKGIYGRNAELEIEFNEITGHACGIVLFDHARATIRNNRITGMGASKNNGGGVLVMCDSDAVIEKNHVSGFTRGVQIAMRGSAVCRNNIVEDVYWHGIDALNHDIGRLSIEQNVFYRCGAAGIAVRADGDQRANRNMVVETGLISPRPSAILVVGAHADAAVRKNTLYDNTVLDESLDHDVPREMFWRTRKKWTRTYRNTPVGVEGRHKFHESAFLTRYGRWMD